MDGGDQVSFDISDVASIQTFVNGRLCYATSNGSNYSVPLDESAVRNVVDVYFTATPALEKDHEISLPVLRPVTDGNATTSTVVTFAADYRPLIEQRANQSIVEISSVRDLPSEIYRTESAAELEMVVRSFRSRWNLSAGQTALIILGADNVSEYSLGFRRTMLTPSFVIFWVAVLGLFWTTMLRQGWLSLTSQGICLLFLSITAFFAPTTFQQPIQLILLSLLVPVAGAFMFGLLPRLLRNRIPSLKLRRAIGVTTLLSILPVAEVVQGDESTSNADALIVSCKVAVTLESRQSAMATVDCMTAFPPGKDGRLQIPVDRFTLIDCSIAGQSMLPKRIDDGLLELIVPASTKDDETPTEDTGWSRRRVRYTIRGVPQWTAGIYRLQIPHPVAPATAVSLTDETGLISSASLRGTDVSSRLMGTGRWEFDGASGRETLDLELTGEQATDSSEGEQVVAIQCEADVSPPDLKLSTTYTFSDTGLAGDIVRIGATPQYRITAIQDRSGNNLTWSVSDDSVVVQLDTETDRRALVVRQAGELTLDLKQKISVGRLMTVDGRTATDRTLRVRTSERFFVESVAAEKEVLKRSDTTGTASTPTFRIDSAAKEIQVNLQELRPSREASIFQEAIVGDDQIDWSAECRLKIEVQPVYRQQIQLSQSVDLTGITAERDGASLIQAWTRNKDRIVVAFREATREEVVLRLTGVLQRSEQKNTALPAISLPDADVQEATLELSTAKNTIAMIGDSGSAIPDVNFDVQSDPIPEQPLRMTLTNESQPPDIRLTPVRRLLIDSALVVYELGDQPFVAELLLLRPEDSRFETRFRLRSDLFAGVQPLAFRNERPLDITEQGGEFVIPPVERGQEGLPTTIVLGRMDDVESSGEVTTHIPDFNTETQISSWSVFDIRERSRRSCNVSRSRTGSAMACRSVKSARKLPVSGIRILTSTTRQ